MAKSRTKDQGGLDLPRLPQGVLANSNADLPMNGGSGDQAEEWIEDVMTFLPKPERNGI